MFASRIETLDIFMTPFWCNLHRMWVLDTWWYSPRVRSKCTQQQGISTLCSIGRPISMAAFDCEVETHTTRHVLDSVHFCKDAETWNHGLNCGPFWWYAIGVFRWWKRIKPTEEGFICKQLDARSSCELRWSSSDTRKRHAMMAIRFCWPGKDGTCCLSYPF